MAQLEQVCLMTSEFLEKARARLARRENNPQAKIMAQLQNNESGRLQCPFCLYQSQGNRTSAVIKNGCFKCFACGKFGRLP